MDTTVKCSQCYAHVDGVYFNENGMRVCHVCAPAQAAADLTRLCIRCGELVPQGCCTCGPRQELAPIPKDDLAPVLGDALGKLLVWYDAVTHYISRVPRHTHIEEIKAAYNAWKENE